MVAHGAPSGHRAKPLPGSRTRCWRFYFPRPDALLVPDRSHRKLAVGARYAAKVPSGEVGKHCVSLEAQPPAQSRGVQDFVVLWHLYPVKISFLHHEGHHTEIIDELREHVNKILTFRG